VLSKLADARDDAQTQHKGRNILREEFAARAEINARRPALSGSTNMDASICRPEVLEQQAYLRIAQLEHSARQMLLMRTLIVDTEAFQP
jgi:hypothetical protein